MVISSLEITFGSGAFTALEIVGTVACAVSGVIAAARARMDWLGAFVLAVVVAIGGGTLRDLLLGRLPVGWLETYWPILVALSTSLLMIALFRLWPDNGIERSRSLVIADAAGLAAFVVLGTDIGLQAGIAPVLAVMLGVLTGVGGGVLRDVLTGVRPMVLTGPVYAAAGIAGAVCFLAMSELGLPPTINTWIAVALVFVVRMFAYHFNWSLPLVDPHRHAVAEPVSAPDQPDASPS